MKILLKVIAFPFALAFGLLYGFFKFVVMIGGTAVSIVAVLAAIASVGIMIFSGFWYGLAWLVLAAIVFALPYLAALMVGVLGALNQGLWGFIKG